MKNSEIPKSIREPQFAGQFYPGGKAGLSNQLSAFFEQSEKFTQHIPYHRSLQALIVPHAGYVFSGQVAASGFQQIPQNTKYKRVFVLASSHRHSFDGAALFCSGNYATPLGEIEVDADLSNQLLQSSDLFIDSPKAHENEHSIEVQLPFLQHRLGSNFLLVPILLGTHKAGTCKKIADVLKKWFTPENLWVISTDFSHYPGYEHARMVDEFTASAICENNPAKLLDVLNENKNLKIENLATSLCGWTSVITLQYMTENKDFVYEKINYQNSGDAKLNDGKDRVVGYWSIAVYAKSNELRISEQEKNELLEKARASISHFVKKGRVAKIIAPVRNGILNEAMGAFVSIYVGGKLRGCIGGFARKKTLNVLVQEMAVSASHDRRFDPIKPDELDQMEIEISVLSPLKKADSVDEIELGKHGIYIKQGNNSGTFLPQVAAKTGWSIEDFLGHCSRDKAGLGWEGWKTAEVFVYEAIVFRST
jgi:AmmeMemoRadiSam system protein B/AmmeMemoRadiSam system protein A